MWTGNTWSILSSTKEVILVAPDTPSQERNQQDKTGSYGLIFGKGSQQQEGNLKHHWGGGQTQITGYGIGTTTKKGTSYTT